MNNQIKRHPGINLLHQDCHADDHNRNEMTLFGFWVFMMSDLILFGLMFAVYVTMIGSTASGPELSELINYKSLTAQTGLLLLSSLTIGIAVLSMKYKDSLKPIYIWLSITLALGLGFLSLEIMDFVSMVNEGAGPSRSGFLSAFFGIVCLHGLHVSLGCVWLITILVQLRVFGLANSIKSRLMRLALLWHFLDLIWIGIFTVVYFGGVLHG